MPDQGSGQPRRSSSRTLLIWPWQRSLQSAVSHNSSELEQIPNGGLSHADEQVPVRKSYRDTVIDEYEEELRKAQHWAGIIGFLHKLSRFLAFCELTGASVALLGAFLPNLLALDFAFITCLLFIEAGRLALMSFFVRLRMRPLAYGSQDPTRINHREDHQYPASHRCRRISNFVQCLLIAPGFILPIRGLRLLHDYSDPPSNLKTSLLIFYIFAVINSFVALGNLLASRQAFEALQDPPEQSMQDPPEQSILRYFDTVLENAMSSGIVQPDVFEFFGFAYTMLGAEFRRNVQPEAVAKNHKRLIHYLNAHRLGLDALKIQLDAADPYVQLAAANMVGFWSDRTWGVGVPVQERQLSQELLKKLADKVGTGQLGWAATSSFGTLAATPEGARMVARVRTSSNMGLPNLLVNLVDESSSRSLSLVRTLVVFYEQCCANEQKNPRPFEDEGNLVNKLERLRREAKVHRLRVLASYFLLLMRERCDAQAIRAIDPNQDAYWFTAEKEMLELLIGHIPPASCPQFPEFSNPDPRNPHVSQEPFLRQGPKISPPPSTSLDSSVTPA